jgi:hypothetical protein
MVVIGWVTESGRVYAREARALATVAQWPRVGRVRLSLASVAGPRPEVNGYLYAQWKGRLPLIETAA